MSGGGAYKSGLLCELGERELRVVYNAQREMAGRGVVVSDEKAIVMGELYYSLLEEGGNELFEAFRAMARAEILAEEFEGVF